MNSHIKNESEGGGVNNYMDFVKEAIKGPFKRYLHIIRRGCKNTLLRILA